MIDHFEYKIDDKEKRNYNRVLLLAENDLL
jgi:hypothetical protein